MWPLFATLSRALGPLAAIWPAASTPLRYPHASEADALRGDGQKIGEDMRRVIDLERIHLHDPRRPGSVRD